MGNSVSKVDFEPREYDNDEDIPFVRDGNDSVIGLSSFGIVENVRGTSSRFADIRAVRKTIDVTHPGCDSGNSVKDEVRRAAVLLARIHHGHVVNVITTYFYNDHERERVSFSIIMSRADRNLEEYIELEQKPHRQWFGCLIGAVSHIHKFGVQHGDIKPGSILIKDDIIFLTSFDVSRIGLIEAAPTSPTRRFSWRTATYASPEVEEQGTYSRSADIFSLGAVFLEMFFAHSFPVEMKTLQSRLQSRNGKSYARNIDAIHHWLADLKLTNLERRMSTIFSLCRKMLNAERDARPEAEELSSEWQSISSDISPPCPTCADIVPATESDRLVAACKTGPVARVKSLLRWGLSAGTQGAIHEASEAGRRDIVQALLECGADIDLKNYGGETALYYAAGNGHQDLVKMLLERRADPNKKDNEGRTALHRAARRGHTATVKTLLEGQAVIDLQDDVGWTALHFATGNGHGDVVRLLLEQKANRDATDNKKQTALHLAARAGNMDLAKEFCRKADVNKRDRKGQTPFNLAAQGGHNEMLKMLLDEGADSRNIPTG